ncbi:hypothetical protein CAEBREN_05590 [Caenorhabditis brenneri]|uniref:C-type lectin domain-containing protein n=1 Tax=Caenorhabditis brenneri TaxID=135651 RepID=G0M9C7_CAEBE|nr:hypothetical protein CAEBREN_05590 [Caenorhabditis brenneri]
MMWLIFLFLVSNSFCMDSDYYEMTLFQGDAVIKYYNPEHHVAVHEGPCTLLCGKNPNCQRTVSNTTLSQDRRSCPKSPTTLPVCDNHFTLFPRFRSWWCLRVIASISPLSYQDGSSLCQKSQAQISGVETEKEVEFVMKQVKVMQEGDQSVLVDGKLSQLCSKSIGGVLDFCKSLQGYTFTDPQLRLKSGYNWAPGKPNNLECLRLDASSNDEKSGKIEDVDCEATYSKFVLCGQYSSLNLTSV